MEYSSFCWSCSDLSSQLHVHPHHSPLSPVGYDQRKDYVQWCTQTLFGELEKPVLYFQRGLEEVMGYVTNTAMMGRDLMEMVVGVEDVKVEELKKITQYEGFDEEESVIEWFWEMMVEMTVSQRIAFLQFATARSRLPTFAHQSQLTVRMSDLKREKAVMMMNGLDWIGLD